jgi:UDPglucose 6-dehydrogenase
MAELGHDVIGVDVDPAKVARLSRGEVPFYEPGLPEMLSKHVKSGRLKFTTDASEAADADVHFIGVGTPQKRGEYAADMTFVDAVIETLAPMLTRPTVILGKSTVPVGTAARLAARVRPSWGGTPSSCAKASPSKTR